MTSHRQSPGFDRSDLEQIFVDDLLDERDVLVDVGCGVGDVIDQWLQMGLDCKIVGLEADEDSAAASSRRFRQHEQVSIEFGDIVAGLPFNGSIFFLNDPYDESTVIRFADAVHHLVVEARRGVMIYYLNCEHLAVFQDDPRFIVQVERLRRVAGQGVQVPRLLATVTLATVAQ